MDNKRTYTGVADYFISFSNETHSLISNLKLQKLVYYAQAWHLAAYKEELFSNEFEAWIHGPVIPALYYDYKQFSWKPIIREDLGNGSFDKIKATFSKETLEILEDIIEEYFVMDAYLLERNTHLESPWINARAGYASDEACTNVITKQSMIDFYSPHVING